ncbi:MAG: ribonuclease HII [Candidatus Sericytochromatia bacterium]|nr:ribonuclease HII [Candidatus Sericytochromatia bacterium]
MWGLLEESWAEGHRVVAGVDEAGRGPLAGPVVAAAVVLPGPAEPGHEAARLGLQGLRDSKQLSATQRRRFAVHIKDHALAWAIVGRPASAIDAEGILACNFAAMRIALGEIVAQGHPVDRVHVDGKLAIRGWSGRQRPLVKGDDRCIAIAAASVLAKTWRDELMERLEVVWPGYGLGRHAGYGTVAHREAILRLGPSPVHRLSFGGVRPDSSDPAGQP